MLRFMRLFSSPKRSVRLATTVSPRVCFGSSDTFRSADWRSRRSRLDVLRRRDRMLRRQRRPRLPCSPSTSTRGPASPASRRDRVAVVGMKTPTVRLLGLKYLAATRRASSTVAVRSRSRWRKSRRQSPMPIHSLSCRPTRSDELSCSSISVRMLCRARSSSSVVGGFVAMPSTIFRRPSRAASSD